MDATRVCNECGEPKPETNEYFARHKTHRGGLNMRCKACRAAATVRRKAADPETARAKQREAQARYRARHPDAGKVEKKEYMARYYRENRERFRRSSAAWKEANPAKAKASIRNWQKANPEKVAEIRRAWVAANPDKVAAKTLRWRQANPEKLTAQHAAWRKANPEKYRAKRARRYARKMAAPDATVFSHRISTLVRHSIASCLAGTATGKNGRKWCDLVGYGVAELMAHIERQFTAGMTWQTWGTFWHLDHIQPVASFRFTSLECPEFRACWALSNLRPLAAKDNIRKGAKRVYLL